MVPVFSTRPALLSNAALALLGLLALVLPETASAQPVALLTSLGKANTLQSGRYLPLETASVLRFVPGTSLETAPFLTPQNLEVLMGDVDQDGEFNDAPSDVDAILSLRRNQRPTTHELIVSFSAASTRFREGPVLDGDLVTLMPDGSFQVFVSETVLCSVTGTRTIDVDAAALMPDGELLVSLTDDEVTTHPILIAQNNNESTLPDEMVIGWKPGTSQVRVVYTKEDVLAMVAKATGKNITTIVDLVGLAPDPNQAGHILFTVGSSAKGLAGAVFTSAGGGAYAVLNGQTQNGDNPWGLTATPALHALTYYLGGKDPLVLEVHGKRLVTPGQAMADVHVHGAAASGTVQIYVSYATSSTPSPFPLPAPLNGVRYGYVVAGDPLFAASSTSPRLKVPVNAQGEGRLQLELGAIPPGQSFLLQAVDLSSYEVSEPVVIDLVKQ
jgi:hypothetical protein